MWYSKNKSSENGHRSVSSLYTDISISWAALSLRQNNPAFPTIFYQAKFLSRYSKTKLIKISKQLPSSSLWKFALLAAEVQLGTIYYEAGLTHAVVSIYLTVSEVLNLEIDNKSREINKYSVTLNSEENCFYNFSQTRQNIRQGCNRAEWGKNYKQQNNSKKILLYKKLLFKNVAQV